MKKVLFLVNHDIVIYNFRLEFVERLIRDGHDIFISSPIGERIKSLIDIGCKYYNISIDRRGTNLLKDLKLIHKYRKLIKEVNPDIIFAYTIKPNIYGAIASKRSKIPFIATITGLGSAIENGGARSQLINFMYRYAFSKIKTVYFQNTENMQYFVKHRLAIGKHKLIPGSGVNLDRFYPLPYPNDDVIEFSFISRIMREKGIDQFLFAAELIKSKYPNTIFHVCGFCEDNYQDILHKMTNNGIIIYHGMVSDIKKILIQTHCLVHPSYYPEGISNILLEACACARPVITTNRSGCREVVDEGLNGYLIKQKDNMDLVYAIEKFIQLDYNEKRLMGLNAREKVKTEFDRSIIVEKYYSELKE